MKKYQYKKYQYKKITNFANFLNNDFSNNPNNNLSDEKIIKCLKDWIDTGKYVKRLSHKEKRKNINNHTLSKI